MLLLLVSGTDLPARGATRFCQCVRTAARQSDRVASRVRGSAGLETSKTLRLKPEASNIRCKQRAQEARSGVSTGKFVAAAEQRMAIAGPSASMLGGNRIGAERSLASNWAALEALREPGLPLREAAT